MKRTAMAAALCFVVGALALQAAEAQKTKTAAPKVSAKVDTVIVIARVTEIPGTFPPNDLYNYVYIMKYRVSKILKGTLAAKEILEGHYNPLIPRAQIKDKMDKCVDGNVEKFEMGAKHKLTLIAPISLVWGEALEDEYFDVSDNKYYALKADLVTE